MKPSQSINNYATSFPFKTALNAAFIRIGAGISIIVVVSYLFAISPSWLSMLSTSSIIGLGYVIMFALIAFVLLMMLRITQFSYSILFILFLLYASVMCTNLSFFILTYTNQLILNKILIVAIMFRAISVYGFSIKSESSETVEVATC